MEKVYAFTNENIAVTTNYTIFQMPKFYRY